MNVDVKLQPIKEQLDRIEAKLNSMKEDTKKEVKQNGRKNDKGITDSSGE